MLRQLWYCVGWFFDPRLWGVDWLWGAAYRLAIPSRMARRIVRKASPEPENSCIAVFATPGPDGEQRVHYVA